MKPFLQELAEDILKQSTPLEQLTLVFPNRRASLYFQKFLSQSLTRPQWSPRLMSIEEFFKEHSSLQEPDRLTLIYRLYQVYTNVLKQDEPFDKFYFWGEMLLRDFDEVDKYRVNAQLLFKDLSKLKELDETFDYLTDEQKQFLRDFWIHFEDKPSHAKEEFLHLWKKLPAVYTEYVKSLAKEKLGYEGMIHREVADSLERKPPEAEVCKRLIFAGFNALTRTEEWLLASYVAQGARVYWDYDDYYVNDKHLEAGMFARQYATHPVLRHTLPAYWPAHLKSKKNLWLTGVSQRIGQAKLAGARVKEIVDKLPVENRESELSKTVIVLPDESLLLAVMHSLPQELTTMNVTMGFPLRATPLFALLDLIIEMQVKRKGESLAHREVTGILGHAYILGLAERDSLAWQESITRKNRIRITTAELESVHPVFALIFRAIEPPAAIDYIVELIQYLGASFSDKQSFDREYAFHFYQHLSRLQGIFKDSDRWPDWRGFQKLFRQILQAQKIPFSGEPLQGLQIMGVLETRNLDFENVILLSMNEGLLPAGQRQGSYIPHTIRKAYGLPSHDHQDAIYAYLFYRLLQRAGHVEMYYNTEPDVLGNGEMSRYVQQLLLESGLEIQRRVLHHPIHVHRSEAIEVAKTPEVLKQLDKYVMQEDGSSDSYLSPSSLNDFIECELRFYLKHVALLKEADEVEEDVDARRFGNILHDVIHWFYEPLKTTKHRIERSDIEQAEASIEGLIDRAFRKQYFLAEDQEVRYEGQRVVVKEVVEAFVSRILELDKNYAPFTLTMLEDRFDFSVVLNDQRSLHIGGKIDRADEKEESVRVIDYKTGADKLEFAGIDSLFARNTNRNKAAFQTFLYAHAYQLKKSTKYPITPGLFNRTNLFSSIFAFGLRLDKQPLTDIASHQTAFASLLKQTLEDLYDPSKPFQQTTHQKNCEFCSYRSLCRR